jgi:hypothetical protein
MSRFTWGVDGFGRCHLCEKGDNKILFSGLLGVSGMELVWVYEDFSV